MTSNTPSHCFQISWVDRSSKESASLLRGVYTLVDKAFADPDYRSSYPLVFGPEPSAEICVALSGQSVVGCLAMLPLTVQNRRATPKLEAAKGNHLGLMRLACLGSVCVSENHRSRGLAESMLHRACLDLAQNHFDGAALFASDSRLYQRVGFAAAQADCLVLCRDVRALLEPNSSTRGLTKHGSMEVRTRLSASHEIPETWVRRLWHLACSCWTSGSFQAVVSYHQFANVLRSTPMQILTAWNGTQSLIETDAPHKLNATDLVGALCYEKGADFKETWHGAFASRTAQTSVVLNLIKKAAELFPSSQLLLDDVTAPLCQTVADKNLLYHSPSFMVRKLYPLKGFQPEGIPEGELLSLAIPSLLSI